MKSQSRTYSFSKFSIVDLKLISGPPESVSFDGNVVKVRDIFYSSNPDKMPDPILVSYSIVGPFGLNIPKIVTLSPLASNSDAVNVSGQRHNPIRNNGFVCFDLSSDLCPPQRRAF